MFASILVLGFIGCDSASGGGDDITDYSPTISKLAGTWELNSSGPSYTYHEDGTVEFSNNSEYTATQTITKTGNNSATYVRSTENFIDYEDDSQDIVYRYQVEGTMSIDEDGYVVQTPVQYRSSTNRPLEDSDWEEGGTVYREKPVIIDSIVYYDAYKRTDAGSGLTGTWEYGYSFYPPEHPDQDSIVTYTLELTDTTLTRLYQYEYSYGGSDESVTGPWEYTKSGNKLIAQPGGITHEIHLYAIRRLPCTHGSKQNINHRGWLEEEITQT